LTTCYSHVKSQIFQIFTKINTYICKMQNRHIIYLAILGAFAILSILVVQIFWVKGALDISQNQFEQTVNIALREVAEKIAKQNKTTFEYKNPVIKINESHYIVNVNSDIDPKLLDYYLASSLDYFNINQDVEYGIYNCHSKELVYCNYIQKRNPQNPTSQIDLPKVEGILYYFTVSFPHYSIVSMHNVPMWVVTSIILMIAVLFFLYALFVVFQQRNISQVQKDFINNMTHEFKTPISTISIIQQVISDPEIVKDPQRLATYSEIIGVETKRLNDQVEKVLNIAKIEKGQFALNKEEVSVNQIIEKIVFQTKAKNDVHASANISHQLCAENDLASVDLVHFTNIILNLIDNAIKYGNEHPEVIIKTENIKDKILIKICDNGQGIDKKDVKKIFEKFYRVPTGNVHNVKGFGLGLYYVNKIVEAHKCKIYVDSELGKGSIFTIEIPFIKK
jgi:two-component system, OmpR family, phosphate regulon sensor histidine kinase PhoR